MQKQNGDCEIYGLLDQILGYLNFSSSGENCEHLLQNVNQLYAHIISSRESQCIDDADDHRTPELRKKAIVSIEENDSPIKSGLDWVTATAADLLIGRLDYLKAHNRTFADSEQAARVIQLVFSDFLPEYLARHQDLLFHRHPNNTFNSFFVGRAIHAVLAISDSELTTADILERIFRKLDNFVGHRPLPTLESRKIEPYASEWVCPIPLYIRGVGVAPGRYQALIGGALAILERTSPSILNAAHFDIERVEELAIDPRCYDFTHPINRRPNFHFGHWDENQISRSGYFKRFIVHEVTLDSILARLNDAENTAGKSMEELATEAAIVMAGTILMASGVCGWGPGAFDSETSLTKLLPQIAEYRDAFYEMALAELQPEHQSRVLEEIQSCHQPFGLARQHLNNYLAHVRSNQIMRSRLAINFARMGYPEAASRQIQQAPTSGTRAICQIEALLAKARTDLHDNDLSALGTIIPEIKGWLVRGIECGAIADPWNILGFDAHYSLFPAVENSTRDDRLDDLLDLVECIVGVCSKAWIVAAVESNDGLCEKVRTQFEDFAHWFRKFAAHEVDAVDSIDPLEIFEATRNVANAIRLWQRNLDKRDSLGGIAFWSQHAELFQSPRAFALTIEAMIERADYDTSMGLLIYWLSQANRIPLEYGETSFCNLSNKWLQRQANQLSKDFNYERIYETWVRFQKFYDYMEANAEEYWQIPQFNLNGRPDRRHIDDLLTAEPEPMEDDSEDELYGAAYEDMVYIDTTNDGIDSSLNEAGTDSDASEAWRTEAENLVEHLMFLEISADLFKMVPAHIPPPDHVRHDERIRGMIEQQLARCVDWQVRSAYVSERIDAVAEQVEKYHLQPRGTDYLSLNDYDRQRQYKESLLEHLVSVSVEFKNARQLLAAWGIALRDQLSSLVESEQAPQAKSSHEDLSARESLAVQGFDDDSERAIVEMLSAVLKFDKEQISSSAETVCREMRGKSILYVPISKGGKCKEMCEVRARQCVIGELLDCLPRLGLYQQAFDITELVLMLEREQKPRSGAVTDFDELFRISLGAMVETLIESGEKFRSSLLDEGHAEKFAAETSEQALFDCVEMLTESMLLIWLSHSRTLRLSVLEKIEDKASWERLKDFIEHYGTNLFTQIYLNPTNIRSILHLGVDQWLTEFSEDPAAQDLPLILDLDRVLPRRLAVKNITMILEAVYENYTEYRDYNSTTTQSDRGEMLFILLDFLRLRAKYERVCWHFKPVTWVHETLVKKNQLRVARRWRRALAERVGTEAKRFLDECERLRKEYSVSMGSIYDRLNEKFVHQMQVDRLCSFVEPAMYAPQSESSQRLFDLIEHLADSLAANNTGPGIDEPAWIVAMSHEIEKIELKIMYGVQETKPLVKTPTLLLSDIRNQIENLPRRTIA
ncbi:MAG TPA: hypothetical protein PKD64_07205 [Pirellulaceae bacterium]|nr:hypothetical protein [Pirellulaceae bacterium]